MRISDWSSDVCSSDLLQNGRSGVQELHGDALKAGAAHVRKGNTALERIGQLRRHIARSVVKARPVGIAAIIGIAMLPGRFGIGRAAAADLQIAFGRDRLGREVDRSEEHTSELQSLMRISYAVFCLKKKT